MKEECQADLDKAELYDCMMEFPAPFCDQICCIILKPELSFVRCLLPDPCKLMAGPFPLDHPGFTRLKRSPGCLEEFKERPACLPGN